MPQQQLFVLNGPFMFEMSREFAKRLSTEASNDLDRVRLGWQLAYASAASLTMRLQLRWNSSSSIGSEPADQLNRCEQLAHAILASNGIHVSSLTRAESP